MDRLPEKESWERLEVLLGEGDGGRLHEYLDGLPPGEPAPTKPIRVCPRDARCATAAEKAEAPSVSR